MNSNLDHTRGNLSTCRFPNNPTIEQIFSLPSGPLYHLNEYSVGIGPCFRRVRFHSHYLRHISKMLRCICCWNNQTCRIGQNNIFVYYRIQFHDPLRSDLLCSRWYCLFPRKTFRVVLSSCRKFWNIDPMNPMYSKQIYILVESPISRCPHSFCKSLFHLLLVFACRIVQSVSSLQKLVRSCN